MTIASRPDMKKCKFCPAPAQWSLVSGTVWTCTVHKDNAYPKVSWNSRGLVHHD